VNVNYVGFQPPVWITGTLFGLIHVANIHRSLSFRHSRTYGVARLPYVKYRTACFQFLPVMGINYLKSSLTTTTFSTT